MSHDLLVQMAHCPSKDQGFRFRLDAGRKVRLFDM